MVGGNDIFPGPPSKGEKQMVSSTSEGTRQKKLTTTITGPEWKGQKRSILLPCKHQSEEVHESNRGPRIQENGQIRQRRQALDQTM